MEEKIPRFRIILTVILTALLLVGVGLAVLRIPRSEGRLEIVQPTPAAASVSSKEIKVYVSGAVARPGVYSMSEGQRIEDALSAAGGAASGADLTRLNLAAKVRDELQIHVPLPGESAGPGSFPSDTLIDINSAPLAVLDTLPDIGPATAQKIIAYREKNGPFKRVEDLTETKLVSASTFSRIKDLITAR
ncbi:MAG: ComEA family DNA-binding protein [Dehalococcoidia bacterium]|nr:ComEA family DNA-binding protein [Dehalococcoidia bacterium]